MDEFDKDRFDGSGFGNNQADEGQADEGQADEGQADNSGPGSDATEDVEFPDVPGIEITTPVVQDVWSEDADGPDVGGQKVRADAVGAQAPQEQDNLTDEAPVSEPVAEEVQEETQPVADVGIDAEAEDEVEAEAEDEDEVEAAWTPDGEPAATWSLDDETTLATNEDVEKSASEAPKDEVPEDEVPEEEAPEEEAPVSEVQDEQVSDVLVGVGAVADSEPDKSRSKVWKIASLVAVLGVLGLAAYIITPRLARSASISDDELTNLRTQIQRALTSQVETSRRLASAKADLIDATKRVAFLDTATGQGQAALDEADQKLKDITAQLDEAIKASDPLRQRLAAARDEADKAQAEAAKVQSWASELEGELAMASEALDGLSAERDVLANDLVTLNKSFTTAQSGSTELKRLLAMIDVGSSVSPVSDRPTEMPISRKELFRRMGQPALAFSDDAVQTVRWDSKHTARTVSDVVTTIDGKPATRAVLDSIADITTWPGAAGKWRLGSGDVLSYAELVILFGQPAGMNGSGAEFTAWWPVGAWAREVSVTVVNGVVTEFAGGEVDAAVVCRLIRHRDEAYKSATAVVEANAAEARRFYDVATAYIVKRMTADSRVIARNGMALSSCTPAAFDSVGVWIARTDGVNGYMTMRAAVDCVWARNDGTKVNERRYVIVTLTGAGGPDEVDEFAVVGPAK